MSLFFFFANRKPRPFSYKPIYYDPQKEDLEKRVEKIKEEMNPASQTRNAKSAIKGSFALGNSFLKRKNGLILLLFFLA